MRILNAAVAATMMLGILPAAAQEQSIQCAPIKTVLETHRDQYGEVPVFVMQAGNGCVFTALASPETRTWSMIMQCDAEKACLVGAGEGFGPAPQSAPPQKPGADL